MESSKTKFFFKELVFLLLKVRKRKTNLFFLAAQGKLLEILKYLNIIKRSGLLKNWLIFDTFNLVTIEKFKNKKTILIEKAKSSTTTIPIVFGENFRSKSFQTIPPAKKIYLLRNVKIIGGFQIISGNNLIITSIPEDPRRGFVAGIWQYITTIKKIKNKALIFFDFNSKKIIKEGVLISGRCSPNYFHCLIEYFGRSYILNKATFLSHKPVLIVDSKMTNSEFECLKILFPDWPIFKKRSDILLNVKKLYFPSINTYHPDWTLIPAEKNADVCFSTLLFLRNTIFDNLKITQSTKRRKIFLERKSGRNIVNNKEVKKMLINMGFESIDPASLSFENQVKLFNESEFIIGAAGSAFTNLIFCNPGTIVVSLVNPFSKRFCMQSNLAKFSKCKFLVFPGFHPQYKQGAEFYNSDLNSLFDSFYINIQKLEMLLIKILKN